MRCSVDYAAPTYRKQAQGIDVPGDPLIITIGVLAFAEKGVYPSYPLAAHHVGAPMRECPQLD